MRKNREQKTKENRLFRRIYLCGTNNDVIDRDENQLHEKTNETHHDEADRNTERDLGEFFLIGLVAALDEAGAVLGEFSQWIDEGV